MPQNTEFTTMRSMLEALAKTMNLIDPEVEHHHEQTAYLSYLIAGQLGIPRERAIYTVYAALLHDIGAVDLEESKPIQELEKEAQALSKRGAKILRELPELEEVANIVEFCQCSWTETERGVRENVEKCEALSELSSIVHLADRISVLINPKERILNQVPKLREYAQAGSGTEFSPRAVEAFLEISKTEFIWLDVLYNPTFLLFFTGNIRSVSLDETVRLSGLMSKIIDFRSPFTAMHSAGVAASACELARLAGMSETECKMMHIAGNLHDIGKLVVPRSILEKPGRLTDEEFNIIREHPYYTRLILMDVENFECIANWAGFHHEKLNGRGYPFHHDENSLDLGSRILAVADIFSAITEVRPYRDGMNREQAMRVMTENMENGSICKDIVTLLHDHYEDIDNIRDHVSREQGKRYFESLS